MSKITRITIDVHHDRMTEEQNKLFELYVSEATLKTPGMGGQSSLIETLVRGHADVKLEVIV